MDLLLDANNNSEKSYSLRPRVAPKRDEDDSDQDESARPTARKKKKSKQKPGRLSKYRRKTANARERSRMREINEAFEALRRAIPHLTPCNDSASEKLTKISTLRLAMKYITALSHALSDSPESEDGDSFLSDYSLTPSDPREHSMTPSSVSEHSDFYEQFFQKTLSPGLHPATEVSLGLGDCEASSARTLPPSEITLDPLPSFYQVSTSILGSERVPFPSLPVPEPPFRTNSLQEPSLDTLLYPSLNFDELFIT